MNRAAGAASAVILHAVILPPRSLARSRPDADDQPAGHTGRATLWQCRRRYHAAAMDTPSGSAARWPA